eukprot:scaffold462_cov90-Cylindrotheca_fusiformis.AAC.3
MSSKRGNSCRLLNHSEMLFHAFLEKARSRSCMRKATELTVLIVLPNGVPPCKAVAPVFEALAREHPDYFSKWMSTKVPKIGSLTGAQESKLRYGIEHDGNVGMCANSSFSVKPNKESHFWSRSSSDSPRLTSLVLVDSMANGRLPKPFTPTDTFCPSSSSCDFSFTMAVLLPNSSSKFLLARSNVAICWSHRDKSHKHLLENRPTHS